MRRFLRQICGMGAFLLFVSPAAVAFELQWEAVPPLPVALGGHATGVVDGHLVVAGGSSFPRPKWEGGEKHWHSDIYVLSAGGDTWEPIAPLPRPLAYAAYASQNDALWLAGGTDGAECFRDLIEIRRTAGEWTVQTHPEVLPEPRAFCAGAAVGSELFVAGGIETPGSVTPLAEVLRIPLGAGNLRAEPLPPFPGSPRILPFASNIGGDLFVGGGAALAPGEAGAARDYLADMWIYAAGRWTACRSLPAPLAAAEALPLGAAHLLVAGGDSGELFAQHTALGAAHPGLSRKLLTYHRITDTWTGIGELPEGIATTAIARWDDAIVIVAGENRPGARTAQVWSGTLPPLPGSLNPVDYATLAGYFAVLLGIGAWFSRREKSTEAFFLGGRRIPWWAVGISIFGTSISAITYLSIPARAYATDWVWALANLGIVFIAPFVAAYYIPRFRQWPIQTAYEFLERRFNLAVRLYGSLCFFAFQIGRVGIVILLPSMALAATTGIDVYYAIVIMGIITTIYTVLGGIEAVIWTDVIQSVVLLGGAIFALVTIIVRLDTNVADAIATAAAADKFHLADFSWDATTATIWVILIGNAFSNLYPATADQTIVQRYLTTADTRSAQRAVWTNALLTIPVTILFFGLGTALWLYFRQHPEGLDPRLQNDTILPLFVVEQFPAGLRGLFIAGVFAAAMSSLDSSINSLSSVIVNDYYRRFVPNVSETAALRAAKVITVFFGLFGTLSAVYVATIDAVSLWDPFLKLLGLVGGGLAGLFALGIFTERANGRGAIAGALLSAAVLYYVQGTPLHFFLHAPIAFALSFGGGYLFSLPFRRAQPQP